MTGTCGSTPTEALAAPRLWSVETHLAACADCRAALAAHVPPAEISAGWARLDAELDAPRPGFAESLLIRAGVADHTARLLAATPVLRRSWLGAVALTLLLAVGVGLAASPLMLLATAPLLPLAGVALSFGPGLDPTYEMAVVAPMHTFRLLMVRTVAVLSTTTLLSGAGESGAAVVRSGGARLAAAGARADRDGRRVDGPAGAASSHRRWSVPAGPPWWC